MYMDGSVDVPVTHDYEVYESVIRESSTWLPNDLQRLIIQYLPMSAYSVAPKSLIDRWEDGWTPPTKCQISKDIDHIEESRIWACDVHGLIRTRPLLGTLLLLHLSFLLLHNLFLDNHSITKW
jgi:hypothetical protein